MAETDINKAKEDLLVMAAQRGDARAFEGLFAIYNPALKRFAYRLCGDEQLAVDAVQEAWITLSKTLQRLKDPRGFRIWAFKTVRWRVTDIPLGTVKSRLNRARTHLREKASPITIGPVATANVRSRQQL